MRWIGQIVGMVATAALVSSFQCRRERTIAAFWTASAALFVLHYLLLGELSGAVMESAIDTVPYGRIAYFSDPFGHGFCLLEFNDAGYDAIAT